MLVIGLRGAGKTVLLDRLRDEAEGGGVHPIRIEAPQNRSLPALLAPALCQALLRPEPKCQSGIDVAERPPRRHTTSCGGRPAMGAASTHQAHSLQPGRAIDDIRPDDVSLAADHLEFRKAGRAAAALQAGQLDTLVFAAKVEAAA